MKAIHNYRDESLFLVQLFILVFLNTFQRSQHDVLKDIGNVSINLTLFMMFLFLIRSFFYYKKSFISQKKIYLSISLFILINAISFIFTRNVDISYFLKVLLLILFILGSIRIDWTTNSIKLLGYMSGIVLILIFVHWYKLDFPNYRFESIYNNPNYLGILLFCMLYFKIISLIHSNSVYEKIYFLILILSNVTLIYNTNSRSVMLAILIMLLALLALIFSKKIAKYLFHIIIVSNILILLFYVNLQNTSLGNFLNNIVLEVTGKSLFSGRVEIWRQLFVKFYENPIFGYGLGVRAMDIIPINLTSHNQYLQILIEYGIIGFIIFIFLLYSIWKLLLKNIGSSVAKCSAAFFIAFLAYENFEVTLFQNNYSIAIIQWLIITIGIGFNKRNVKS